MKIDFYPSLISSDLLNLRSVMQSLDPYVAGYHLDVMDNHFVPNLTWGPSFINAFVHNTEQPLQVHLMVDDPFRWTETLALRSRDYFIFHHEAALHGPIIKKIIAAVREKGWKCGVALNPATTPEVVAPYLPQIDLVLVMSVNPGFSGQQFMPEVLEKIPALVSLIAQERSAAVISIDGGINATTIEAVVRAGVRNIGLASALFAASSSVNALLDLQARVKKIQQ